ncbi:MAG TPA: hypothetical protein PKM44_13360, partial [Turneriella sp.]|nr:hypothetical protein [Turneriella sp.]
MDKEHTAGLCKKRLPGSDKLEQLFTMKKLQQSLALAAVLLSVPASFAQKGAKKDEAPTVSAAAEPAAAQPRGRTPQMDATAFG